MPNKGICAVEGCERDAFCKGWCGKHYARAHKTGDPLCVLPGRWDGYQKPPCSVVGCERPHSANGFCAMHNTRVWAGGVPGEVDALYAPDGMDLLDRWWAKVDKDGPLPTYAPFLGCCWCWLGKPNKLGYGAIQVDHRSRPAYRVGYELLVGPVPDGLVLDHLCRVPICVRPSHLEPVTQAENALRGYGIMAEYARKTVCVNGHPLVGPDARLYDDPRGRVCIPCHNANQRALYRKRKAEREAATIT